MAADLLDWEVDGSPSAGSLPRVPGLLSGGIQLNISPDYVNAAGFWAPILIVLGAAITIAGLALQSREYMPNPENFYNKTCNAISACLSLIASRVCFCLFMIADRRDLSCCVVSQHFPAQGAAQRAELRRLLRHHEAGSKRRLGRV